MLNLLPLLSTLGGGSVGEEFGGFQPRSVPVDSNREATRIVLLCDIQHDGRVSWKANLEKNSMTFEEVWKANKTQDCVAAIQAAAAAHASARAKF